MQSEGKISVISFFTVFSLRIAPSFPTPEELEVAAQVFVLSVKLVSIDKILGEKVEVEEA